VVETGILPVTGYESDTIPLQSQCQKARAVCSATPIVHIGESDTLRRKKNCIQRYRPKVMNRDGRASVLVYADKRAAHTSNGAAEYSVLGSFASSRASCIMRLTAGVVMSLHDEGVG
jgi:hypothetical protein